MQLLHVIISFELSYNFISKNNPAPVHILENFQYYGRLQSFYVKHLR